MYIDSRNNKEDFNKKIWTAESNIRCLVDVGFKINYFINPNFRLQFQYVFEDERNPLNVSNSNGSSKHRFNNSFVLRGKYTF